MVLVKDADKEKLTAGLAEALEKLPEMKQPEWSYFVKTGVSKERPPTQKNWWYIRGASVIRNVYVSNRGVSKLRKVYGGRKNRGHKPEHSFRASGKVIRVILQQLEAAELVKKEKAKGRVITPKGQKFMDNVAKSLK
jgi:small subunit ribosomal protein S19e